MPLSRTERFKLKSHMLDDINQDNSNWDIRRLNLLLSEFGLETIEGGWNGPTFEEIIANISDTELYEMYSLVTGTKPVELLEADGSMELGNWKAGYVRMFISHSAKEKEFVGRVAEELAVVGIHGFVAHNAMEYSKPWQEQIEQALRSMQAFVVIVHPEVETSAWCNQEIGWAIGKRVPRFAIGIDADVTGFLGREQWPSGQDSSSREIANMISKWASSVPELGETMTAGLFAALAGANNYMDAGATAKRIANLSGLTATQWDQLNAIFWSNDQIYNGGLPKNALMPFYTQNHQTWPPEKPLGLVTDPWAGK